MKLVAKLKFFGIITACLLLVLGLITYWRFMQVDLTITKSTVASNIVKDAFILTVLNDDYIRSHGKRAEVQWISQHRRLDAQIDSYRDENSNEQQTLSQLRYEQKTILTHFSQLQKIIAKQGTTSIETPIEQLAIERLSGQLSVDMQSIVSLTSSLAEGNNQRLAIVRQTTDGLILTLIGLLCLWFIVSYFFFARSISRSVNKLIVGTKVLASGNLSYRFTHKDKDEFGQIAHSFNEMAAQLQELDQAKDEFLALASHELRTPMTAIKGLMSMIMNGDYGPVGQELHKPLKNISISTERQIHLINELLNVSRLQTGKIDFQTTHFSLEEVTKEIVESLQPIAEQKGVKLTLSTDHRTLVNADSNWTKQILNNLIGNALKFTDKGSVTVSYKMEQIRSLILVTDTGIGISKEDQKKLFRKFQQFSTDVSGKPAGSGLGLYISREIARKMGGDVWLESSTPKGSVFIFSLPKAA